MGSALTQTCKSIFLPKKKLLDTSVPAGSTSGNYFRTRVLPAQIHSGNLL